MTDSRFEFSHDTLQCLPNPIKLKANVVSHSCEVRGYIAAGFDVVGTRKGRATIKTNQLLLRHAQKVLQYHWEEDVIILALARHLVGAVNHTKNDCSDYN
ncbi:MAG: hypothetical protein GY770_24510 [Aestuariibacter sp.]|nr:hypothetical protein [Aestuariibacter sp.]MCP4236709.1 hypothetical protein [Aestuariibacter sp.]MCP4527022.1 hypothetical protein [Aestuariibacter sp.]